MTFKNRNETPSMVTNSKVIIGEITAVVNRLETDIEYRTVNGIVVSCCTAGGNRTGTILAKIKINLQNYLLVSK